MRREIQNLKGPIKLTRILAELFVFCQKKSDNSSKKYPLCFAELKEQYSLDIKWSWNLKRYLQSCLQLGPHQN